MTDQLTAEPSEPTLNPWSRVPIHPYFRAGVRARERVGGRF